MQKPVKESCLLGESARAKYEEMLRKEVQAAPSQRVGAVSV
jgi:hypothetical protein